MRTDERSVNNISPERFGVVLDQIRDEFGKIATYLVSSPNPTTAADKVGLMFTILAFGIILTPIALSDSDPYHLKVILEEVKDFVPSLDNLDNNQDKSEYRIIAHLKISPELNFESTEKIILGKINSKTF